jgi:hypothetical protein
MMTHSIRSQGIRPTAVLISLTSLLCLGVLTYAWLAARGLRDRPFAKPVSLSTNVAEHRVMHVKTANGRGAIVHCWQPRTNAVEVSFEPQGDRVFVRAQPKRHVTQ